MQSLGERRWYMTVMVASMYVWSAIEHAGATEAARLLDPRLRGKS